MPPLAGLAEEIGARLKPNLTPRVNPLLPTLGHPHLEHVIFHNDVLAPLEYGDVALGDPAYDLGLVIAQLHVTTLHYHGCYAPLEPLLEAFEAEYRRHGGLEHLGRVRGYVAYGLVTHAARHPADPHRVSQWLDKAGSLL